MQYFILLPGDSEKDTYLSTNLLGESSFNTFYAEAGLKALMRIVNKRPEILPDITIMTDKNQKLTVEEFLSDIREMRVLTN